MSLESLLAAVTADTAWQADAACRGLDPETFFPVRGESTAAAKETCAACPVQAICREAGLDEKHGIWGGLSERERRRVRQARGPRYAKRAECGTRSGYQRHLNEGTEPCAQCRAANARKVADVRDLPGRTEAGAFPVMNETRRVGVLDLPLDATG